MTRARHTSLKIIDFISVSVIVRAAIIALVIGSMLTAINQGDALMGGSEIAVVSLIMVFLTPFLVVLISQAWGARAAADDAALALPQAEDESLFQTAAAHGIPLRAALLAVLMGVLNTGALIATNMASTGELGPLPITPLIPAFVLPAVFGLLSQTISYRRGNANIGTADRGRPKPQLVS